MKKLATLVILSLTLTSCMNYIFNTALEQRGIFKDQIDLKSLSLEEKEIIFFPMHHVGTEKFYTDVHQKIDSLKDNEYFFYVESIKDENSNLENQMKLRKIMGIGIPEGGYQKSFDSILKVKNYKLKKEIVYQPTYSEWQLDEKNSLNVDVDIKDLIQQYELIYGEVKLEPCDYDKPDVTNSTECTNKTDKKKWNYVLKDYRNQELVKHLQQDSRKKIAIIYGSAHYEGVKSIIDSLNHN